MLLIEPNSSTALLSMLWRASWQAAVLFGLVFVFLLLAKRFVAPNYRVILWMLPLLRMLVLVVPVSSFSMFNAADSLSSLSRTLPNARTVQLNNSTNVFGSPSQTPFGNPSSPGLVPDSIHSAGVASSVDASAIDSNRNLGSFAFIVWIAGMGFLSMRWLAGYVRLRKLIRQAQPIESVRDLGQPLDLMHLKLRRRPRVLVSGADLGPAASGIFRPVILIPKQLAESLDEHQLIAIVSHESKHIRRYDAVVLGLARVASIIHWFNPLVYLNLIVLRRDIELAVDCATIRGLGDAQRQNYGRLLLQLATSNDNPYGLVQMASRRSQIRSRIEAIARPQRTGWFRSAIAVVVIVALMFTGLSDRAKTQEQTTANTTRAAVTEVFAVTGQVIDKETGKPVAGAKVQFLVDTEQDPDKRMRIGKTDDNGSYRIEVPMGAVKLWFPELKPGYWLPPDEAMVGVTTSPEQPEATLRIEAHRGPIWKVRAIGEAGDTPILTAMEESDAENRAKLLRGDPVQWDVSPPQAFSFLDGEGYGALTQVGQSGGLLVGVVNVNGEIVADPNFDNTQVVKVGPQDSQDRTTLFDRNGKQAVISNAEVTLDDGVPLLTYKLKPMAPAATQSLTGRLVGQDDSPISDARIGVSAGRKDSGSAVWPGETVTDAEGRFSLDVAVSSHFNTADNKKGLQFSVTINKAGFASRDADAIDADADFSPIDFGTIRLEPGFSMPVLVLGPGGKPVAGAAVEPQGNYALRRQAVRTDSNGKAILKNIPAGLLRVSVNHGDQYASSKLVVSEDPQENTTATLRIDKLADAQAKMPERPVPIAVGADAPDLEVSGWSDGKPRKLSDYAGKIVVLDFWGIWCGPCIQAIPAMKTLAEKYEGDEVVFLGVHTADGDIGQINKLKKSMQWDTPSGLDLGSSVTDSKTCLAYGIRGYPSVVIVDASGKIAFNSSIEPESREAMMKEMEGIAKANGIPWPPNEKSEEEMKDTMTRLQVALFSREIDRALAK